MADEQPDYWPSTLRRREEKMRVICDICGGEMRMSFTHKKGEEEDHIKFTCIKCGHAEYLT